MVSAEGQQMAVFRMKKVVDKIVCLEDKQNIEWF
jgi:hypothetical protein